MSLHVGDRVKIVKAIVNDVWDQTTWKTLMDGLIGKTFVIDAILKNGYSCEKDDFSPEGMFIWPIDCLALVDAATPSEYPDLFYQDRVKVST